MSDMHVYVDAETTHQDARIGQVFETAWAVGDGPIQSLILPHTLRGAHPRALEVNRYHERRIAHMPTCTRRDLDKFLAAFAAPNGGRGRTLVGANPRFDVGYLWAPLLGRDPWHARGRRALRLPAPTPPVEPWHYRLLDVETYAAAVFGWEVPAGLLAIRNQLIMLGYPVPAPDHTAGGDVATVRAAHKALIHYQTQQVTGVARTQSVDGRAES